MNSIRQKLQMGYIIGFGSLWILCGLAVYFSYRAGLLAGVESELYSQIRLVRMAQMRGMGFGTGPGGPFQTGKMPNSMMAADLYWQNWPMNEGVATRSENLTIDLPRLNPDFGENLLSTQYLENGVTVMMVGGRFGMGDRGAEITVARNLASTHSKLKKAALGITFAGIVFASVSILWVFHIIRTGLAPIKTIANQVNAIDTDSLGNSFGTVDVPVELLPITTRLDQLMDRLEKSFVRERNFSSDLSHEIRTPIAELRVIAESAIKWPDEGGPEAWSMVLESLNRTENVLQTMLRLSRIEQAQTIQATEEIVLRQMFNNLWTTQIEKAQKRGLTLQFNGALETMISGDPTLWRNLLGNLLGNAVEYADAGTNVEVTLKAADSNGIGPTICIANAASSLSQEDLPKLFDRFWRGDVSRKESNHCGLGLPVARACAESMNWLIQAIKGPDDEYLKMCIKPSMD